MKIDWKQINLRLFALLLLIAGVGLGLFVNQDQTKAGEPSEFALGLDLSGGSYLVYEADVSQLPDAEVDDRMDSLRDVIERRVNLFGVGEPSVQTEVSKLAGAGEQHRLVVELPGITDLDEAIESIGQTPLLEFKVENPDFDQSAVQTAIQAAIDSAGDLVDEDGNINVDLSNIDLEEQYLDTELTGALLKRSTLQFQGGGHVGGGLGAPTIALEFNKEGADLFAQITRDNVGQTVAIFLDGAVISAPTVQQEITGGEAVITGVFEPGEARQLVGRLNSGALPVPIELLSTQTIGPSLGSDAIAAGIRAGLVGLGLVIIFLILWYRIPGLLASIALVIYAFIVLAIFKLVPVTLTAAGIAGFIISLGIAVDANILIFERLKEELRAGRTVYDSSKEGFSRAWSSIRDANISSLISAAILFWFGSSLIKGFALTFGIGVLISMLSAIFITRYFLYAVSGRTNSKLMRFLYSTGLHSGEAPDNNY